MNDKPNMIVAHFLRFNVSIPIIVDFNVHLAACIASRSALQGGDYVPIVCRWNDALALVSLNNHVGR
jgi:hypothetical protein